MAETYKKILKDNSKVQVESAIRDGEGVKISTNYAKKSEIPDVSNFITKSVDDLTNYTLSTGVGTTIDLSINSSTYVVTLSLKNSSGTVLSTDTIDLPLESVVVSGSYDDTTKKIVLTLQSGSTVEFSVADLVSGLQSEITSSNKLSSDLVDDTNNTNKFVTTSEKSTWNGKQDVITSSNKLDYSLLDNTPSIPSTASDVGALPNSTKYGASLSVSGTSVQLKDQDGNNLGTAITTQDTTYESKTASSGGTAVSLVTTGEKYTWNNKSNFSGSYNDLSDKPTIPSAVTSVNGLSGGKLTSPLEISGGDSTTASKIALDQTASGQITNNATQTIFGFTSNNATNLTVGHSSYGLKLRGSGTRPQFNSNDLALYSDIPTNVSTFTNDAGYTTNTGTITGVQLNGSTIASSGVANIQALPNYSLSIGSTNGGNPRQVLFCSVNYTNFDSNSGAYFKLGAMSGHGNGSSYTFVEDIFINVNYQGAVTCNVYKYVQQSVTLENVARNYGDIFWTIDTTNKIVYFYILLGQYSSAQFTPGTKIGAAKAVTSTNGIVQYTGTPTYYSSGTKVWATGNSTTYAKLSDIPSVPTFWSGTQQQYDAITTKDSNTYYFIEEE